MTHLTACVMLLGQTSADVADRRERRQRRERCKRKLHRWRKGPDPLSKDSSSLPCPTYAQTNKQTGTHCFSLSLFLAGRCLKQEQSRIEYEPPKEFTWVKMWVILFVTAEKNPWELHYLPDLQVDSFCFEVQRCTQASRHFMRHPPSVHTYPIVITPDHEGETRKDKSLVLTILVFVSGL